MREPLLSWSRISWSRMTVCSSGLGSAGDSSSSTPLAARVISRSLLIGRMMQK